MDFFPPVVDDPYSFGQIAAANALSDIYAMGGEPRLAMNLLCFPSCLDLQYVRAILEGGQSKVEEAGAVIAGGHSIEDAEPKYGLSVTGYAHPQAILTNANAQEGDLLVLTKPLGSGILSTAAKAGLLDAPNHQQVVAWMAKLNRNAQQAMLPLAPHACTDITGFGLLGHALELAKGSGKTVEIFANAVPLMPQALDFARDGIIPAGAYSNMEHTLRDIEIANDVPQELADVLFDPQTSGGLLIAIAEAKGKELLQRLNERGETAAVVGQVRAKQQKYIYVK